jgi:hypothetical protein
MLGSVKQVITDVKRLARKERIGGYGPDAIGLALQEESSLEHPPSRTIRLHPASGPAMFLLWRLETPGFHPW